MFAKPNAGWSELEINEDFSFPASYLTDIPNDFIKALTVALKDNISTAVTIDGESHGECIVLFNMYENCVTVIYDIIHGRKIREFYRFTPLEFAKEFIKDIEDNLNDWNNWMSDDEEEYSFDIDPLKQLVNQISGGNN